MLLKLPDQAKSFGALYTNTPPERPPSLSLASQVMSTNVYTLTWEVAYWILSCTRTHPTSYLGKDSSRDWGGRGHGSACHLSSAPA